MPDLSKIDVFVITGFLGAGKTSFLNQVLKQPNYANSAVIINEFGEVSLDHLLVEKSDDQLIELANGCICCSVRGQLVETLEMVAKRNPARIIIETTGLADPLPVLQAIIHAPELVGALNYSGMITLVDSLQGLDLVEKHEEAKKQVVMADVLCLTKLDKDNCKLDDLTAKLSVLNPIAQIVKRDDLLKDPLALAMGAKIIGLPKAHGHHHHNINVHNEMIRSITLRLDKPVSRDKVDMFIQLLLSAHGQQILRVKGLISIVEKLGPLLLQAVGPILSEPIYMPSWPDEDRSTRIVVFVDGLEAEFVERLFYGFMDVPQIDTADGAALSDNPLSIAGFKPTL